MFSYIVMYTGVTEYVSAGLQSSGCGIEILTECTVGWVRSHTYPLRVRLQGSKHMIEHVIAAHWRC